MLKWLSRTARHHPQPIIIAIFDDYVFCGNFGEKSLQIGNAVPVQLGEVMGRQLVNCINEINGQA